MTALTRILLNHARRIGDLRSHFEARFDERRARWTAELHRVEEVLAAPRKHPEERWQR
jgi:hypothetical protein